MRLNHSAEAILRQDQADDRRPYWQYGQGHMRRDWRKSAPALPKTKMGVSRRRAPTASERLRDAQASRYAPLLVDRRADRETELIQSHNISLLG